MATDWGSLINAGVSLWNGNQAAKAAKSAGNQAAAGSEQATALQREIYQDQRNLTMPAYNDGEAARSRLMSLMGLQSGGASGGGAFSPQGQNMGQVQPQLSAHEAYLRDNPDVAAHKQYGKDPYGHFVRYGGKEGRTWGVPQQSQQGFGGGQLSQMAQPQMSQQDAFAQFRNTPGYQFGLDEGNKSVEASAAARGGLNSGATLKALTKFGQGYADQQGYTPYVSRLQSLAGLATTAGAQMGAYGSNFANNAGQNAVNAANARGQSTYDAANARQQGYGQAAYFGGKAYDAWRGG